MRHDELPGELVDIIEDAVRVLPAPTPDLARVRRAATARHRRRVVSAVAAALLTLILTVTVPLAWDRRPTPAPAQPTPTAAPSEQALTGVPAQRMLVTPFAGFNFADAFVLAEDAEVRPDGAVVPFRFAGGTGTEAGLVPTGDGGVARLSGQPVAGPCPEAQQWRLEVLRADGTRSLLRDLGTDCRYADLLGVHGDGAYLRRGATVYRHDLASAAERVVADVVRDLGYPAEPYPGNVAGPPAELDHGRLVFGKWTLCVSNARVVWYDLATSRRTTVTLSKPCNGYRTVRVSPDGASVAVLYLAAPPGRRVPDLHIDVLDAATGGVRYSAVLGTGVRPAALAWHDDCSLRVAWYPTPGSGRFLLRDLLRLTVVWPE